MPLAKYDRAFGGKKGSAQKAHVSMVSKYGLKEGEQVFYAMKNKKMKAKMKSMLPKGASLSPKGDIGKMRQEEARKAGGFKSGTTVSASKYLPNRPGKYAKGN